MRVFLNVFASCTHGKYPGEMSNSLKWPQDGLCYHLKYNLSLKTKEKWGDEVTRKSRVNRVRLVMKTKLVPSPWMTFWLI